MAHIAAVENYFRISFIEKRKLTKKEEKEILPGLEMGKYISVIIAEDKPLEHFIEELAISRKKILEAISTIDTKEFHKKQNGYNEKTGFNLAWALYHMSEDEIHHRGQISIVSKLYNINDGK